MKSGQCYYCKNLFTDTEQEIQVCGYENEVNKLDVDLDKQDCNFFEFDGGKTNE